MTSQLELFDGFILGIETSCDETAAAVIRNGREVMSSVIASQVERHAPFGGVVPEIASRAHLELLQPSVEQAVTDAGLALGDLDAIAVTRGPGLAGALLVGLAGAKGLALALRIPLVGVNHLEGHLFSVLLERPDFTPPAVALIVSGGHTMLVHMADWGEYQVVGTTLDDAAGEAFDKIGRFLGMGFPGGPAIDQASRTGDADAYDLPRPMIDDGYDFSLSGLKTAVVLAVEAEERAGHQIVVDDMAASFQEAVVDVQVRKTLRVVDDLGVGRVLMGGGVAANSRLRDRMRDGCKAAGVECFASSTGLCTDNGAMIAAAGAYRLVVNGPSSLDIGVDPSLKDPFSLVTTGASTGNVAADSRLGS